MNEFAKKLITYIIINNMGSLKFSLRELKVKSLFPIKLLIDPKIKDILFEMDTENILNSERII